VEEELEEVEAAPLRLTAWAERPPASSIDSITAASEYLVEVLMINPP
jgi:hypothetical protein